MFDKFTFELDFMLLLIFKLQLHLINMERNQNNDVERDIKLIKIEELLDKFQSKSVF